MMEWEKGPLFTICSARMFDKTLQVSIFQRIGVKSRIKSADPGRRDQQSPHVRDKAFAKGPSACCKKSTATHIIVQSPKFWIGEFWTLIQRSGARFL